MENCLGKVERWLFKQLALLESFSFRWQQECDRHPTAGGTISKSGIAHIEIVFFFKNLTFLVLIH